MEFYRSAFNILLPFPRFVWTHFLCVRRLGRRARSKSAHSITQRRRAPACSPTRTFFPSLHNQRDWSRVCTHTCLLSLCGGDHPRRPPPPLVNRNSLVLKASPRSIRQILFSLRPLIFLKGFCTEKLFYSLHAWGFFWPQVSYYFQLKADEIFLF